MPWAVLLHISLISIWVASLLLVAAVCAERSATRPEDNTLRVTMALRIFTWVATLGAVLAVVTGMWLMYARGFSGGWLPVKLALVALLSCVHLYLGALVDRVRDGRRYSGWHYLGVSSATLLVAVPIIALVVTKPF